MAPTTRGSSKSTAAVDSKQKKQPESNHEDKMDIDSDHNTRKRKAHPTNSKASQPDAKAAKTKSESSTSSANPKQVINFLLSADSLPYCYPEEELSASKTDKLNKTYSMTPPSSFTPFEQLMISHLLSKPLSHRLGMRSIRTVLNPPYDFSTAQKVKEAGEDKVWNAINDSKTQHVQKTAKQIYQMAEKYCDDETMFELAEEVNEDGAKGVVNHIKSTVDGMGEIGAQLFCRRIQCVDGWGDAVWPYVDPKAMDSLKKLGIEVQDADDLQSLVEEVVDWEKVGQMGLDKLVATGSERDDADGKVEEMDHEQRVQVEFVVLLERAIGCVLEGRVEEMMEKAKEW